MTDKEPITIPVHLVIDGHLLASTVQTVMLQKQRGASVKKGVYAQVIDLFDKVKGAISEIEFLLGTEDD